MNMEIQEEKAVLSLQLTELTRRCPPSICNGSIQVTRKWLADQKAARSILGNKRSTVRDLMQACSKMRDYLKEGS